MAYIKEAAARERHRQAHPLRPPRSSPPTGPTPTTAGPSPSSATAKQSTITCSLPVRLQRLLQLRRGLLAEVRRLRGLRGHDRASAALAGGPRLRRQEDRRHRQRRHRGDADSRAGRIRAPGTSRCCSARRPTSASLPAVDPIAERANKLLPAKVAHVVEPLEGHRASAPRSTNWRGSFPNYMRKTLLTMAERRLPEGYDVEKHFGPQLQPVGPAAVPGAQRRSVQDHPQGQGRRRHRHHRAVHRDRHQARPPVSELRCRHHRHRNGFEHAAVRRREAISATASPST